MLFNSFIFVFFFLPITLFGFYFLSIRHQKLAIGWLVIASFVFYGWWNPVYILLIILSISFNYSIGRIIVLLRAMPRAARAVLIVGVVANISLLGYYKYADFFVETINEVLGTNWIFTSLVLPLAISFFTFQQIAYLVDTFSSKIR